MAATIIGATGATQQPTRYVEDPETGRRTTERWEGPASAIAALVPQKRMPGMRLEYVLSEQGAFLERTSSGASAVSQTQDDLEAENQAVWELVPQQMSRDLKLAGYFASGAAADKKGYAQVDTDLNNPAKNVAAIDYNTLYTATKANRYRDLRLQGHDSFIWYSYILRYVRVLGRETNVNIDATDVNDVAAIPVPRVQTIIRFVQGLGYEWLKKAPSFRTVGTDRYELAMEWWGTNQWIADVYANGSG